MVQREKVETYTCPLCGAELHRQQNALHCQEHGDFFPYGPKMVVRSSDSVAPNGHHVAMPWENKRSK